MKRILFSYCLISSFFVTAQNTIIQEKYEKNNHPIDHFVLSKSNLFVISKGDNIGGLVKADAINSMSTYDSEGSKKVLFNDKKIIGTMFSVSDKCLLVTDISSGMFNSKTKYLIDDKYTEIGKSDIKDMRSFYGGSGSFTAKNEFYLKNKKDDFDIDFVKDDLYLSVKDIVTRKKNTYKIEKPNLNNFIGPNFIKSKEKFRFNFVVNDDETVDLDGKSISKDYTNTILYKVKFSTDGKKVNELAYDLKIPNHVFLYSRNGGGKFTDGGYDNKFLHFGDDLSINNYIKDVKTGDIYIYGLYGDELGKLNDIASPKGFYIFKFDKSGNKVWESINKIDDSGFNSKLVMVQVFVDLVQLNDNVCFSIRTGGLKDFFHYSIVDKTSGKMIKAQNVEFNESFAHANNIGNMEYGINTNFKGFKNIKFDFNSIIAINSNPKVADYIKNVKSSNDLLFSSKFSDLGIWLYESDEKEYFKVTLFKG
ncbi:hypothetical protein C8C85_1672 [Flavobacterium sp. 103]|uniref:hypothetical protein n=1 Tax=Flavobacterium sp. 103 TaxID=2135624 RepID=UPI000D5CDE8B|nr:hypothetical protein [Flavobacterium sp. 103]PVX45865.1 hypothetical protein C8C85_1672 [Flavobacterium sp. 103]